MRSKPAAAALVLTIAVAQALAAPVLDRVLAVVSGTIVTLSDVNAAIGLGLVDVSGAEDRVGAALEQLIERTLQLAEMERYAPPEPDAQVVTERVQQMVARLGGTSAAPEALASYGLDEDRLRAVARDDVRLQGYLDQRFSSVSEPTEDEVLRYYREHQDAFVRGGVPQPLDEVAAEIRRRLEATRRAALIEEWSRSLRLRADVLVIPSAS